MTGTPQKNNFIKMRTGLERHFCNAYKEPFNVFINRYQWIVLMLATSHLSCKHRSNNGNISTSDNTTVPQKASELPQTMLQRLNVGNMYFDNMINYQSFMTFLLSYMTCTRTLNPLKKVNVKKDCMCMLKRHYISYNSALIFSASFHIPVCLIA